MSTATCRPKGAAPIVAAAARLYAATSDGLIPVETPLRPHQKGRGGPHSAPSISGREDRVAMSEFGKVPVTVVTGFLGAGKTTLIRHLLQGAHGRRLALDHQRVRRCRGRRRHPALLRSSRSCPEENIVELANGCLCCTVADDFVPAIEALLARNAASRPYRGRDLGARAAETPRQGVRLAGHPGQSDSRWRRGGG